MGTICRRTEHRRQQTDSVVPRLRTKTGNRGHAIVRGGTSPKERDAETRCPGRICKRSEEMKMKSCDYELGGGSIGTSPFSPPPPFLISPYSGALPTSPQDSSQVDHSRVCTCTMVSFQKACWMLSHARHLPSPSSAHSPSRCRLQSSDTWPKVYRTSTTFAS